MLMHGSGPGGRCSNPLALRQFPQVRQLALQEEVKECLDSNQAVTRDECRAYLVWQHCFSRVLLTHVLSISWRRGGVER